MITCQAAGMTDRGLKRSSNEDALFLDDRNGLFVVADGMGGHNAGEIASRMVVECMMHAVQGQVSDGSDGDDGLAEKGLSRQAIQLSAWIRESNRLVREAAQKHSAYKGMGATVAAVWIEGNHVAVANVGDSPIYLFHRNHIETLSMMHNVATEYHGRYPDAESEITQRYGGLLTRAVGMSETTTPHLCDAYVYPNDRIVLCSDGLSDLVDAEEIRDRAMHASPLDCCSQLVALANKRGGIDNISVIVIRMRRLPMIFHRLFRLGFCRVSKR